MFTDMVMPAVT